VEERQPAGQLGCLRQFPSSAIRRERALLQLDRALVLFKEGRALATECDQLLKGAQQQIEAVESAGQKEEAGPGEEIPF